MTAWYVPSASWAWACAVHADGPGNAWYAPDAKHVVVRNGLEIVNVAGAGVHHPNILPLRIADLAGGAEHDAAKDSALFGNQKAGEADAEYDRVVLAAISKQHF